MKSGLYYYEVLRSQWVKRGGGCGCRGPTSVGMIVALWKKGGGEEKQTLTKKVWWSISLVPNV